MFVVGNRSIITYKNKGYVSTVVHLVCQMQQILLLMNEERCQTDRDELIKLLTKGQSCGLSL